ncbi:MAG TPA: sigma-70 family RNA polymerase sigma factor [Anaeromyxobacteraceae bacterium]|nr:sigma-70 family RNA polymerase sigma factor [Anaeromyxobacteraceae bacterium]
MLAYLGGDALAFERLFRALAPSLMAFFMRSAKNAAVAEDLLQTTFLKLHGARGSWRPGERLRPWVFAIAARTRIDWLRRHGRVEELAEEEDLASAPDPADPREGLLERERGERVRAALERLSEPQRMVVHLHRFEGLSFAEIGLILGISEGAAKLRAFRAYGQLRGLLQDLVEEERP